MNGALIFGLLIALGIFVIFFGIYRLVPRRDPVAERLVEYGQMDLPANLEGTVRPVLPLTQRLLAGLGLGPKLAAALARADLPLTAAEYALIIFGAGFLGFALGWLRANSAVGLLLAVIFGYLPIFYLHWTEARRKRAFTRQLPDVITLLAGSLRAGYGLNQAIELLVDQMPEPAAKEFGRTLAAVNLGVPLVRALQEMAQRVGSDDLDLVVMAITVQNEVGGNLAHVLETIGHTVRERIRILREVRVLSAQQRLTGYILAAVPVFLTVMLSILLPGYFDPFFEPGLIRVVPIVGIMLMLVGFFLIQRIVDIKV